MVINKTVGSGSPGGKNQPEQKVTNVPSFNIRDLEYKDKYLKLLIYGCPGVGKTTLACSAAYVEEMQDVLLINAEGGELSVMDTPNMDQIEVKSFDVLEKIKKFLIRHIDLRENDDIEELRKLEAYVKQVDPSEIETPRKYNTIIIDSLTELEAYHLDKLAGITPHTPLDADTDTLEWSEYKRNHAKIHTLIRALRDLRIHVIFICGENYDQDENKRYRYSIDLTGKLKIKIQRFMDMVGYLVHSKNESNKSEWTLLVTPGRGRKYDAKHRYKKFKEDKFVNPTMQSIIAATKLT